MVREIKIIFNLVDIWECSVFFYYSYNLYIYIFKI